MILRENGRALPEALKSQIKAMAHAALDAYLTEEEQGPKWLDSALLLDLEKKLLDVFNGQAGFCRGEDDGDIIDAGLVLANCDFFPVL